MFDPLILAPVPAPLWHAFQGDRMGDAHAVPARHQAVVSRWRRVRALGAPVEGPRPDDAVGRGAALRERTQRLEPLLAAGQRVLEGAAATAATHDYLLTVADADGVIVSAWGGGAFAEVAERARLIPGADLSEVRRGTNAIGTAVTEKRAVFVQGNAHFARPYHGLVCYAAPVHAPDGEVVAIVDATSVQELADPAMGFRMVAAAQALEEVLRLRAWSGAGADVLRTLVRSVERMGCPALLIEAPGRTIHTNSAARALLGAHSAPREVLRSLGLPFRELATLAQTERAAEADLTVMRGGRRYRLRLEPIESGGHLLAVLALLEPALRVRAHVARSDEMCTDETTVEVGNVETTPAFGNVLAEDPNLRAALATAARLAPSLLPVLLVAESGSERERIARGLHAASRRSHGPFVAVDCRALDARQAAAALFGHDTTTPTALGHLGRDGHLDAAAGGTIFLDEVTALPLPVQAALLLFLERGVYRRVGEAVERAVDARVVCGTCSDPATMVAGDRLQPTLFFRLRSAMVRIPSLRERSDLLALVRRLLAECAADIGQATPDLTRGAEAALAAYDWPGNVRELRATLQAALVEAQGATPLRRRHLPGRITEARKPPLPPTATRVGAEAAALMRALSEANGNLSDAARRLDVARSTLYRLMRKHHLRP
ncbi:MAG: sigma 54-interacting transcriptional regulator [Planctomycetota bacterium]